MRVGRRLFVAFIPAGLGVLAMAGLAYWGQRGRQIPEALLWTGIIAAVVTFALAWHNTRYVVRRLEALAARRPPAERAGDEIESIERAVHQAEASAHARAEAAETRAAGYAALLADAAHVMAKRMEEVRLPLHILLDSPFGDLNENQEEMISAAHAAASAADERVRTLARVLQIDAGEVRVDPRPIRPRDLISPLLPAADVSPALPHVLADARLAREALALILHPSVRLTATSAGASVVLHVEGASVPELAARLLRLQGAEVDVNELRITFPAAHTESAWIGAAGG